MHIRAVVLIALTVMAGLRVDAAQQSQRRTPATPTSTASRCSAILGADTSAFPNTTIRFESATVNPARPAEGNAVALPEHCEVIGRLNERIGFNSQRYAIRFHMRLPSQWNGRFFFQGGGGTNGNLGDALGNLQGSQRGNALVLGYTVVSQDSGHDNNVNNDPNLNGPSTFGFDPQARIDFGYRSYDEVTKTAKALIRLYYGRQPDRSYYVGCSEGGREGMLMSQKFADHYDGILSCAPGFNIPRAALAQASDFQTFAQAARSAGVYDRYGQPFVNKVFTDEDLALVSAAVLEGCDEFDGAKDGIVSDFPRCTTAAVRPKLAAVTCKSAKRTSCLSVAQVTALERVFEGGRNAAGARLYSDWPWDAGIGGRSGDGYFQGWRAWRLGDFDAESVSSIATALVAPSTAALTSPPVPVSVHGSGPSVYLHGLDLSRSDQMLSAVSRPTYAISTQDLIHAGSTDLTRFNKRGGKLLIAHGVSDPIFSINDTIAWWNDLNATSGGTASDFVRVFAVPGMQHCAGGPATDQFDAFGALVSWVEKGMAPDQIVARSGAASPWPGRTRPLCAYPKIARYKGKGSLEEASSFECR
jgi:tannase/feruloyl esterase